MKRRVKKLELCRETLVKLQDGVMVEVAGGVRTEDGSCPASACHPSVCPSWCPGC